jgi:hypothetical protein
VVLPLLNPNNADAVLFKPFEAGELARVIERVLLKPEPTSCN